MKKRLKFFLTFVMLGLSLQGFAQTAAEPVAPKSEVQTSQLPHSGRDVTRYIAAKDDLDMWPFGPLTTLVSGAGTAADESVVLRYSTSIADLSRIQAKEYTAETGIVLPDFDLITLDYSFGFDFWVSKLVLLMVGGAATVLYNGTRRARRYQYQQDGTRRSKHSGKQIHLKSEASSKGEEELRQSAKVLFLAPLLNSDKTGSADPELKQPGT